MLLNGGRLGDGRAQSSICGTGQANAPAQAAESAAELVAAAPTPPTPHVSWDSLFVVGGVGDRADVFAMALQLGDFFAARRVLQQSGRGKTSRGEMVSVRREGQLYETGVVASFPNAIL